MPPADEHGQPPGATQPAPAGRAKAGRPSVITPELLAGATAMCDKRELTMALIARALKVGRSTPLQAPRPPPKDQRRGRAAA
jgi:hypothetical protein